MNASLIKVWSRNPQIRLQIVVGILKILQTSNGIRYHGLVPGLPIGRTHFAKFIGLEEK